MISTRLRSTVQQPRLDLRQPAGQERLSVHPKSSCHNSLSYFPRVIFLKYLFVQPCSYNVIGFNQARIEMQALDLATKKQMFTLEEFFMGVNV